LKRSIADSVTERVVHGLETVDVEKEHRETGPASRGFADGELQPLAEEPPVEEPAQLIPMREVGEFFFRSLALERVAQRLAQDVAAERSLREIVLGARSHRAESKPLLVERTEGYER